MEALPCDKVFVLGAGFSRLADFPLVSTLRQDVLGYIRRNRRCADWKPHLRCGGHGYATGQFRAGLRGLGDLGFEELMAKLDELLVCARDEDPAHVTRKMLVQGVSRLLWDIDGRMRSGLPSAYSNFAGWAGRGRHAIVSFNWDLVAERALDSACVRWGYSIESGQTPVLKPHGSINWSRHREAGLVGDREAGWVPISNQSKYTYRPCAPFEDPFSNASQGVHVNDDLRYALMPGSDEVGSCSARLIWDEVTKAIEARDAVVFIGYSLPEYDGFARRLLRECASGKQIQAITPDVSHGEEFKKLFGSDVAICQQTFEDCPYARPQQ